MKEIKFRFRIKDLRKDSSNYGKVLVVYHTLEDIMKGRYTYQYVETLSKDEYTGFKDKNNKEVFHNDISFNAKTDSKYVVTWYDKEGIFYLKGIEKDCFGKKPEDLLLYVVKKQEIIGNKFENPELLKEIK